MKNRVLILDDKNLNLSWLPDMLDKSQYDVEYKIVSNQASDLNINGEKELIIQFISSDNEENALSYLATIKERYPKTMRVAFSDFDNKGFVDKIIESNLAKMHVYKPWDEEQITTMVAHLFHYKNRLNSPALLDAINSINQLPTLPKIYQEITALVEKGADMDVIAKAIEKDIAIASQVLRVANSAFYGAKTGSILQATMFLGTDSIKNIILCTNLFERAKKTHDIEKIWTHSELSNRIANHFYYYINGKKMPTVISSIGLIHNIGLLLMMTKFSESFLNVYDNYLKNKEKTLLKFEKEILGYTHCELGAYLLEWWELPHPITDAAMYFSNPMAREVLYKESVCITHIASFLASEIIGGKLFNLKLNLETLAYLGISQVKLNDFKEQSKMF